MSERSEHLYSGKTYAEENRYPEAHDRVLVVRIGPDIASVAPEHNSVRQAGITGTLWGFIPQTGGEMFWVQHDESGDVGAYRLNEIAQISRDLGPVNPEPPSEE